MKNKILLAMMLILAVLFVAQLTTNTNAAALHNNGNQIVHCCWWELDIVYDDNIPPGPPRWEWVQYCMDVPRQVCESNAQL